MAYVPLNIPIYTAAFAGAMAGLGVPSGAFIIDPATADYATNASVAAVFAQAIDTAWGASQAANAYDTFAISNASTAIFARGPGYPLRTPLTVQTNWTTAATAIVAMVKQGDTYSSNTQNITLPGGPNRAYGRMGTATTSGGVGPTVVAAVKLIAKGSGIFKAWVNLEYDATAADVVTLTIRVFLDTVPGTPLTLTNAASMGFGSNGVAQPGNVAVTNNGPFTSNNALGIMINGASGYTEDIIAVTAAGACLLMWENIVSGDVPVAGSETPVPIGQTCLVSVSLTNSVAARATGYITLGMQEL